MKPLQLFRLQQLERRPAIARLSEGYLEEGRLGTAQPSRRPAVSSSGDHVHAGQTSEVSKTSEVSVEDVGTLVEKQACYHFLPTRARRLHKSPISVH